MTITELVAGLRAKHGEKVPMPSWVLSEAEVGWHWLGWLLKRDWTVGTGFTLGEPGTTGPLVCMHRIGFITLTPQRKELWVDAGTAIEALAAAVDRELSDE